MADNKHRIEVVDGPDRSGDKFFYGPDVGQAVMRGDFLYTKYGAVFPHHNAAVRMLPCDTVDENYADWSEEHRSAVREAYVTRCHKIEAEYAALRARRDVLVEQARAKLTAEEFDAVCDQATDNRW